MKLKNELEEIIRMSKLIDKFGDEHNITPDTLYEINLALEEILTNIISYGFEDKLKHNIFIEGHLHNNILKIKIEDDGIAFDPLSIKEPDLESNIEERQIGGLGIHLVKTLMQNISYLRENEKNVLILEKLLKCTEDLIPIK
ncbi:MAG: ATP-binding protein [Candidatus Cloacimonetes bacterium]|nr:ATP-binding protein [Candidatus Cloacimonadota bacterium]